MKSSNDCLFMKHRLQRLTNRLNTVIRTLFTEEKALFKMPVMSSRSSVVVTEQNTEKKLEQNK